MANTIAAAKQASASVLIAQQQVHAAKENVLLQQRIAAEKENHAEMLRQKSESAAAIGRSESAASAQAVSTFFYFVIYKFRCFDWTGLLCVAPHPFGFSL